MMSIFLASPLRWRGEVRCAAHCPPRAHLCQGRTAAHEMRAGAARMMQTTPPARRLTTLCVRARTLRDPPSSLYGCWLGHSFASGGGLTQPSDVPMIPEPTPSHSLAQHACLMPSASQRQAPWEGSRLAAAARPRATSSTE